MYGRRITLAVAIAALAVAASWPLPAQGHCDTMDGPVVRAAKASLDSGDVTLVLRWVQPADDKQIRDAFQKTLAVRAKGDQAQQLADQWFFETLVRIHRAGEGMPYTGVKPHGTEIEPGIVAADKAMETGSVDAALKMLTEAVSRGVRQRFEHAQAAARHADESVEKGREAVATYVQFMHYVEGVHAAASAAGHDHGVAAVEAHGAAAAEVHQAADGHARKTPAAAAQEHQGH